MGGALLVSFALARPGVAQQVQVTTPQVGVRDSFYEYFGVGWGFHFAGPKGYLFFDRGGGDTAIPVFGGFNPNSAARFGWGGRGPDGGFHFNVTAAQGSSRTLVAESATLVVPNGGRGLVQDITVRPFVTGFVPVVGGASVSPVAERIERLRQGEVPPTSGEPELSLSGGPSEVRSSFSRPAVPARSTAERGDVSLAEIRRQQAASAAKSDYELELLINSARLAEANGRFGAARVRYRQAAEKAAGELQRELWAKHAELVGK